MNVDNSYIVKKTYNKQCLRSISVSKCDQYHINLSYWIKILQILVTIVVTVWRNLTEICLQFYTT